MKPSILIVDDDAEIRQMICKMLATVNLQALGASNGIKAMSIVKKQPVDLVITDIVMPEQEGLETIRQLKKGYPHIKIIAISGGGKMDNAKNYLSVAKAFGADIVLSKPFLTKELLSSVTALTGGDAWSVKPA